VVAAAAAARSSLIKHSNIPNSNVPAGQTDPVWCTVACMPRAATEQPCSSLFKNHQTIWCGGDKRSQAHRASSHPDATPCTPSLLQALNCAPNNHHWLPQPPNRPYDLSAALRTYVRCAAARTTTIGRRPRPCQRATPYSAPRTTSHPQPPTAMACGACWSAPHVTATSAPTAYSDGPWRLLDRQTTKYVTAMNSTK
jgi:hypothetical protein